MAAAERFAAWVERRGLGTPGQVALAWALRREEVSTAIIGASRVEQLEENLKAGDIKLSAADWSEAEAVARGSGPRGHKRTSSKRSSPKARRKMKR